MNPRTCDLRHFAVLSRAMLCLAFLAPVLSACSDANGANAGGNGSQGPQSGALYVNSNQPGGNDIVAFKHDANGNLSALQKISTKGFGTAGPTESQDSVVLNADHTLLFTVNVASDNISVFRVDPNTFKLTFVQKIASGGDRPVELAVRKNLLYVVNSGKPSGITGFRIAADGTLTPIKGSSRPLSFGDNSPFGNVHVQCQTIFPAFAANQMCSVAQPADIRFTPNGKFLVVSERLVNQFSVYNVDKNGVAGERHSRTSSGESPFGIDFDNNGHMLVAESFLDSPGTPGSANIPTSGNGAASSYNITAKGDTRIVTGSLKTGKRTGCWMVVTPSGRYAYMTNPGGASISGFKVSGDGKLKLINGSGSVAASHDPRDEDITLDGRFLYVLNNGAGSVNGYRINKDGTLDSITTTGRTLAQFGQGLAAF